MPDFTLYRADDNLALTVRVTDMVLELSGSIYVLRAPNGIGAISLIYQPQHAIELGAKANGTRPAQVLPMYAPPSTVTYLLFSSTVTIPFTIEGILAAVATLPLHKHPESPFAPALVDPATLLGTASAQEARAQARTGAAVVPSNSANPAADGAANFDLTTLAPTEVAVPSRLRLLVAGGATRFVHAGKPVTHDGRTELFNSRLAVATSAGVTRPMEAPTRALADPVLSIAIDNPFDPDPDAGVDAVWKQQVTDGDLTTIPSQATALDVKNQTRTADGALRVQHLRLTPLGGTTQLSGSWAAGATAAYQHRIVLGRDEKALVTTRGHLFPFGHRAVLATTTIRRPDGATNGTPIGLRTVSTVIVREPVKSFQDGDQTGRAFPWRSVEILNPVSPPGDLGLPGGITYLEVGGEPFRSSCLAVDRAGNVVTFELPLLFVPDGTSQSAAAGVWTTVAQGFPDFRDLTLHGQKVALAPPPVGGSGSDADATAVTATTVKLASGPGLGSEQDVARFRPTVAEFVGSVPVLEGAAARTVRTVKYAQRFLDKGFAAGNGTPGSGNPGEILMDLAGPAVDLGKRAAGLAAPSFQVTGISRSVGTVAGNLADVGDKVFKPETWFGDTTILGVFPLRQLLPASTSLAKAPRQFGETIDGLRTHVTTWETELVPKGQSVVFGNAVLSAPGDVPVTLSLRVEASVDARGVARTKATTRVADAILGLGLGGDPVVTLPVPRLVFESVDGEAPTTDIAVGLVSFHGPLSFVGPLADLLRNLALGQQKSPAALTGQAMARAGQGANGPSLEVLDKSVRAGFSIDAPDLAFGMFSLTDLAFRSRFELFFNGERPTLELEFASFAAPFQVTVAMLGGTGYLRVLLDTSGLQKLEGSLGFGAQVAVNLGVVKGSVSITGGLVIEILGSAVSLSGFLLVRGEVSVLSLVSVCLQVSVIVTYVTTSGKVEGEAELAFKVKVFMFSKTVKTKFRKEFVGGSDPGTGRVGAASAAGAPTLTAATSGSTAPTFADLMASSASGPQPWDDYCAAFAAG